MSTRRRNAGGPDRNARWPNVTEIQTILFDGARWHPTDAQVWALDHGFKAHKIDQPAEYIRIRQHPPADYMKDRFRTISLSDAKGIKAIIGVPLKKTGRQRRKAAEAKAHNRNPHQQHRTARRRNYHMTVRDFGGNAYRIVLSLPGAARTRVDTRGWAQILKDDEVGFIDVEPENAQGRKAPRDYLAVSSIFVASEFRRQGLGSALYDEALKLAHRKGYDGIASDPEDRNAASDPFWRRAETYMGWNVRTAADVPVAAEAKAHNRNPHPENRMARRRRNTAKTHTVNALLVAETPLRDWTRGPGRPARALRTLPLTGGYEARLKYSYGAGWRGFYAKGVKATVWGPRQPTQGKAAKALARAILEKT